MGLIYEGNRKALKFFERQNSFRVYVEKKKGSFLREF